MSTTRKVAVPRGSRLFWLAETQPHLQENTLAVIMRLISETLDQKPSPIRPQAGFTLRSVHNCPIA
jgi:hypothetical protein